jgi:CheY-like chemotaxis protein
MIGRVEDRVGWKSSILKIPQVMLCSGIAFHSSSFIMKSAPIVLIEDDTDDKEILEMILQDLDITNPLLWFSNGPDAFEYLKTTTEQPFLILSDVNLPGMSGIEFKKKVDDHPELRKKCIPFVLYSTSVDKKTVEDAYTKMTVQGFFKKNSAYDDIKNTIRIIHEYWTYCRHPNSC